MLKRAIEINPKDQSIQRALGAVYASLVLVGVHTPTRNEAARSVFAPTALMAILKSTNPALIHGAARAFQKQLNIGCGLVIGFFEPSIESE